MALSLLNIPLLLISNSLQPLITKKLAEETEASSGAGSLLKTIIQVLLVASLIYLGIYILSPFFIDFYLGSNWSKSVDFIKMLCLPFAFLLVGNSVSGAFIVNQKQRANLIIKVIFTLVLTVGVASLIHFKASLYFIVMLFAMVISLEEIAKLLYLMFKVKNVQRKTLL